ncbi:MAG TPA: response regulator, partial [Nocardioides sp.]|nr:response regulator [Nocardioides sp.]
MRLVLAEDHALLRDGLIRILEAHDHEIVAAVENADALTEALADPSAEAAVLDVRLPPTHTDEGLRAAVGVRARRSGFPVMVLSQYVERIYARELLASGEGG